MKKFKTESQKILDLMINSIYTHKEIFIRELLSNASDAIDKLYYKSLKENLSFAKEDFSIKIEIDKPNRTLKVIDNGIGMTEEELADNLGVIARSGSLDFKQNIDKDEDINIIGQFGVGFYSAFMVSDKVEVLSLAYGAEQANLWSSKGAKGYDISPAEKSGHGTEITMTIKKDTEEEHYDEFLEEYKIRELVKKYSDYIGYPILLDVERTKTDDEGGKTEKYTETQTLNSMVPLWKKNKSQLTQEDYDTFYKDTFYDHEKPLDTIHFSAEGMSTNFNAVLFFPSRAPYNYYSKTYEKGLKLYTNGILIMDKCADLLPDYFSFVKGVVDSELTLNISRETIQHNHQLKRIAAGLEKKIKSQLVSMLENDRENYEKLFKEFGLQLKYGVYDNWGMNKDTLKDLLLFYSIKKDKLVTIKEYFDDMKDSQQYIYYAAGKSIDAIKTLPQTERVLDYDYDILCLTQDIDEFAVKILAEYGEKEFRSVSSGELGLADESITIETEEDKEIIAFIKEVLGDKVSKVKLSARLKTHAVCLSTEGEISIEMEKVFRAMPNAQEISAQKVLELNSSHPIYEKIRSLFPDNKEEIRDLAKILFAQAQLIEGLPVDNLVEYTDLVCKKLS